MTPPPSRTSPARTSIARTACVVGGVILLVASPVVGIIPGPGGIVVFAVGLGLLLKGSHRAKRYFVAARRRWPKLGDMADRGLRRASASRRRARARSSAQAGTRIGPAR